MDDDMASTENLWGNLKALPDMELPREILGSQKDHLEEALAGRVLAEVRQSKSQGKIRLDFRVSPSGFEELERELLSVTHGIDIYPATVTDSLSPGHDMVVADDSDFKRAVGKILSSQEAHHVVNKMRLVAGSK